MRVGTKSILFGAHAFWLHPFIVALAWWKLYGFPRAPWLWVVFFVHDLGYWGLPNMDGDGGGQHPRWGAHVMYWIQGMWLYFTGVAWRRWTFKSTGEVISVWKIKRRWASAHLSVARQDTIWGNEVMFHSRFLAKEYGAKPSRLCLADKMVIAIEPWWFYLPRVWLSGELALYRKTASDRREGPHENPDLSAKEWWIELQAYMRRWVDEHKDGRPDTWTPEPEPNS